MTIESLPMLNATLNGVATLLIVAAFIAIKAKRYRTHGTLMCSAFVVSSVFLVGYLVHKAYHPDIRLRERFPGLPETWAYFYWFVILIPHLILAIAMLPMIYMAFMRAFQRKWELHKWWTRFTIWVWLYVSVTGVLIYYLLYHLFPAMTSGATVASGV